jgi:hypothetical protein
MIVGLRFSIQKAKIGFNRAATCVKYDEAAEKRMKGNST